MALASFQLMLDRGQLRDWFSSPEICIEAASAGMFAYIAVVHMLTARDPFIKFAIFLDRNFLLSTMVATVLGVFVIGVVPIMTTMMQNLLGYPIMLTGILSAPRALGNIMCMLVVGRIVSKVDTRAVLLMGLALLMSSLWMLANMSLDISQATMGLVGFLQGCGSGFVFLPLTLVAFSTLRPEYRNEAAALFSLSRNLGAAAGISVIQTLTIRDTATVQSRLVEHIRPDNPLMSWGMPSFDPTMTSTISSTMGEITRQATMVAYVDSYRMLLLLAVVIAPLCLMMRGAKPASGPAPVVHVE